MPSYGSLHSPSLRKMNENVDRGSSRERRGLGHSFSFGRVHKSDGKRHTDLSRAHCWRSIRSCDNIYCIREFAHKDASLKDLTEPCCVAGLDDCFYRLPHIGHPIGFPEFRMVGHCIHAMLYRWGVSSCGIRFSPNLPCSGTYRWTQ